MSLVSFAQAKAGYFHERYHPHVSDLGQPIKMVKPVYPERAKSLWQQETVVLEVVVGEDGHVRDVRALGYCCLSGGFVQAATDAVKQWIYTPYRLDGKALTVTTKVTVNFVLDEHTSPLDVCTVLKNPDAYDGKVLNVKGRIHHEGDLLLLSSSACRGGIVIAQPREKNTNETFERYKDTMVSLRGSFERHTAPGQLAFTRLTLEKVLPR